MLQSIPPEVIEIVVHSVMNPGTIVAGYLIGRNADQPQKIIVGAFAAGLAGVLFAWIVMRIGLAINRPSLFPGIFVLSFILGALWAWLGYFAASARRNK
jgi:high-affinity Fe2+/Pb2+ permease